ncbi:putative deoxynucleotidyltransferase terminal-interacting protein 2 [Scophthalmus maximus]|uniref:Putative deoxynucleotidyltransferase terminal-interacting protein 2 n=1 Tax=Scophthalmus maximus TaxID=52904 RepID=A0A2U9C2Z5_SCOMX|nr:deoxynucleotidyltransferase terminal-interacting protein 2 [Scophthalmus maximus]AWP10985.1 putative deoxynucleotidyltransferase terminal-interacting protein 2 [Scophthalmus maximus]
MVSTRRGVRVSSPAKTNPDQSTDVPATPSGRRTRSTVRHAESPTHHALVETSSQLEKSESGPPVSPPTSSVKRCTRASRLHSPEQPCTPVGSTHEADMSDLESGCSVLSDTEPPATRSRGKRRPACAVSQEDEEISEVESCSSAVSAFKASQVSRRSTRRKTAPECSDPAPVAAGEVKVDLVLENESCSSVASESKRVTRSQRKTARTRSAAKRDTEDSEASDADSCASSVSTAEVSRTTTRRATKSRMSAHHIPFDLDEASDHSHSPAPRGRQTRAARGKAIATVDARESLSPDSEGFESGPTYSMTTRRRGKSQSTGPKALDSDSDRGTPCSSRTGSGNSSRGVRVTRHAVKELCVVLEKAKEMIEEDSSLNDSRLESTLITEDADCTLLEEHMNQTLEEKEADLTSNEANAKIVERGEDVSEPAVMAKDQQEELSAENKDKDASEVETMQEMIQSSTPLKPCQSVTVTICEEASGATEEKGQTMDEADVDAHSSQGEKAAGEDTSEETRPSVEEEMEVSTPLNTDTQQVVDSREVQVESIQVTSSQQHTITVESNSEQQPKDVTVRKTKVLSLLESSDDEDAEAENEVSGEEEEDLGCMEEEERGGPSTMSEAAAASVEGLFMIDTRPGQEVDEHYFKERPTEQGEEDEEFVDEEGDDDADDDEDANILFSSRNPQLKDLSSRIDPGIRVKELGGLYINFGDGKSKPVSSSLKKLKEKKMQDEVMRKSVIGPDFEKMDAVPPYSESKQALKLKHRAEREKSTGDGWFNMKAPELSQELKGDLQVLKMRGSMDPKRFYKKNDRDGFPKYFQVGTVVDSPVDFYHSRVPKKGRKRTMVGELLADAEFRQKNKKKFQQIVTERAAQGAGKRNRKKSKFHKK